MVYYLVRLQHHCITEDFGTVDDSDPYDHYLGDTDERTNLRFMVVNDKELEELLDAYIPDDPYNYESINVMCEFYYDHEVDRFIECMQDRKVKR
jgi:hypothetical protein